MSNNNYKKYINRICDISAFANVANAADCIIQDVCELLIKNGVKPDSNLLKDIKKIIDVKNKQ